MQTHYLKITPHAFEAVLDGTKTCEVRKNDRAFQKGDIAYLEEIKIVEPVITQPQYAHTGRVIKIEMTHVTNFMQKEDVVVISFKKLPRDKGMKNAPATGKRQPLRKPARAAGGNRPGKQVDGKNRNKSTQQRDRKKRT